MQNANKTLQLRVEERTQDLKDAQQELVESSKLAALGRMSSAITHELNQPLTGLKTLLSSNQLLMERGETKMLKANMDLVMSLIDRMANMTSQLKSFAFKRLEKPYPVSLTDALQETLRIHQADLENVDIRVRIASNISMVMGEESKAKPSSWKPDSKRNRRHSKSNTRDHCYQRTYRSTTRDHQSAR